eukprot:scaffold26041_cov42-Cyclotella_meneghiniana.AAC.3
MSDASDDDDVSMDSIPEEEEDTRILSGHNPRNSEIDHYDEFDMDDESAITWWDDCKVDEVVSHAIRLLDTNEPYTVKFAMLNIEDDGSGNAEIMMWDEDEIF